MEIKLASLTGRVITLAVSTPSFHGKTAGRVRHIEGTLSGTTNYWVGDFCFGADAVVTPERYEGELFDAWQFNEPQGNY